MAAISIGSLRYSFAIMFKILLGALRLWDINMLWFAYIVAELGSVFRGIVRVRVGVRELQSMFCLEGLDNS